MCIKQQALKPDAQLFDDQTRSSLDYVLLLLLLLLLTGAGGRPTPARVFCVIIIIRVLAFFFLKPCVQPTHSILPRITIISNSHRDRYACFIIIIHMLRRCTSTTLFWVSPPPPLFLFSLSFITEAHSSCPRIKAILHTLDPVCCQCVWFLISICLVDFYFVPIHHLRLQVSSGWQ